MPASRMAIDRHAPAEPVPQIGAHAAHLFDDIRDGDVGAQIVANHGDRDALPVRPARHVAEHRRVERAPPATMDENRKRRIVVLPGQKEIDHLARRAAVGQAELGAIVLEHLGAVKLRFQRPASENIGMLRDAGAIVIFSLVIDRGHPAPPLGVLLDVPFGELRRQIAGKSAANLLHVRRAGKLPPAPCRQSAHGPEANLKTVSGSNAAR